MGWCPKVTGRASTMPAPHRPDRYLRLLAAPGWDERGPLRRPSGTIKYLEKQSSGWERQMAIARSKDPNRDSLIEADERREEPEEYAREVCTGNIEKTYAEKRSREELIRTVVETFVLPLGTNGCSARSRTRRACSRSGSWNADQNRKTPTEEDCRQNEFKTLLATYAREGYTVSTHFMQSIFICLTSERLANLYLNIVLLAVTLAVIIAFGSHLNRQEALLMHMAEAQFSTVDAALKVCENHCSELRDSFGDVSFGTWL
ncbi:hypothetical protein T07_12795 [Trichinella nelsoni]|uniref:Uncharacterized protein n=1 Tax=Trichinella nelsoni TaxID=6336 RepID=A0A0V0SJ52_9BILA|nr:hypothetical protein T07_12795 [Trichinella nelsoni]